MMNVSTSMDRNKQVCTTFNEASKDVEHDESFEEEEGRISFGFLRASDAPGPNGGTLR